MFCVGGSIPLRATAPITGLTSRLNRWDKTAVKVPVWVCVVVALVVVVLAGCVVSARGAARSCAGAVFMADLVVSGVDVSADTRADYERGRDACALRVGGF